MAPPGLARLQEEFGRSIGTPFEFADAPGDYRLQTERYSQEILDRMVPRGPISGAERLSAYNQQYWFRLFTVMQEEYPLLRHLLGLAEFNPMVSAYLEQHAPSSRLLRDLSAQLPSFLAGDERWNRPLILECAQLEHTLIQTFDAAQLPPLDARGLDADAQAAMAGTPLCFQPHWFLFEEHWNLVELRPAARADGEDRETLEPAARHTCWAIYRHTVDAHPGRTHFEPLGTIQHRLLGLLASGTSLIAAGERLATELPADELEFLQAHITGWFAHWTARGWFAQAR